MQELHGDSGASLLPLQYSRRGRKNEEVFICGAGDDDSAVRLWQEFGFRNGFSAICRRSHGYCGTAGGLLFRGGCGGGVFRQGHGAFGGA